jgi:hypothetical protein
MSGSFSIAQGAFGMLPLNGMTSGHSLGQEGTDIAAVFY